MRLSSRIPLACTPGMGRAARRYIRTRAATLKPNSLNHYVIVLRNFLEYLHKAYPRVKSFRRLRRSPHIEGYLQHLFRQYPRNGSRRRRLILIRRFFQDIQRWGWQQAPTEELIFQEDLPPQQHYLPRPVAAKHDAAIQDVLQQDDTLEAHALLVLRATGMRIGELRDVDLESITKLANGQWTLKVPLGKLHNERIIPLSEQAVQSVQRIRQLRGDPRPRRRRRAGDTTVRFLVMRPNGTRVSYHALRYKLLRAAETAGVADHVTPHRLRHSFASELLCAGMRIVALAKLLGHRSIAMTLRYAALTPTHLFAQFYCAVEKIRARQMFLPAPDSSLKSDQPFTPEEALYTLRQIATGLETYRRDHPRLLRRRRLQRLGERLQRLIGDLEHCLGKQ